MATDYWPHDLIWAGGSYVSTVWDCSLNVVARTMLIWRFVTWREAVSMWRINSIRTMVWSAECNQWKHCLYVFASDISWRRVVQYCMLCYYIKHKFLLRVNLDNIKEYAVRTHVATNRQNNTVKFNWWDKENCRKVWTLWLLMGHIFECLYNCCRNSSGLRYNSFLLHEVRIA
jgi:hypothetical protein